MNTEDGNKLATCAAALRRRHFEAEVVKDAAEAFERIKAAVEAFDPATVSFGDSVTMRATGIIDYLRGDDRYRVFDGFDPAMPRSERLEIRRQGLLADLFITGVNALTEDGALLWLDMVGNRVAPIAFGPRRVILVAGRNKIAGDRESAEERIRNIAAPQNVAHHPGFRTPCAKTGVCTDCSSPDRICNIWLRLERCYPEKRILVVLIDEDLGF